jgi:mycoredoxin
MEPTREDLTDYVPEEGTVTLLTTSWCGFCRRLKHQLEREGVTFGEVDIETSDEAAGVVMALNGGDRTVPTVVFPDGSSATNPSVHEVMARLGR